MSHRTKIIRAIRHATRHVNILPAGRSLIGRLARDRDGNTLGIALATIILLVSLLGSGVDMARAYMTKSSLQNACDAGVLAGRKAMSASGTYGAAETAKANKMFDFNFNPSSANAQSIAFNTTSSGTGAVNGTATTTMPTAIMGVFGFRSISLTAACSAELQMASADVMFVLDTTGSMIYGTDSSCCNQPDSKIMGLRQAIRNFYTTVAAAVGDKTSTRIRFGFVPYTSNVNLSDLISSGDMPKSYFADSQPMQTALANFNTPVTVGTDKPPVISTETYATKITQSQCYSYGTNSYPTNGGNPINGGGPAPKSTTIRTYSYNTWIRSSNDLGTCVRNKSVTTTTYVTRYQFTNWRFAAATINVAAFKSAGSLPVPYEISATATVPNAGTYDMPTLGAMVGTTGVTGIYTLSTKWNGCLEERATVPDFAMSPVPSGATDLDMDSPPVDDATRWKLYLPDVEWFRGSINVEERIETSLKGETSRQVNECPPAAKLFTEVDTTDPTVVPPWLDSYINTLVAESNSTYHDIGMIWGARLASPTGIFKNNVNADQAKYSSVSRNIIFMTDGEMSIKGQQYSAYGTELYDNRVSPGAVSLNAYHNNRFLAACQKAKNLGYTIWVIGFGSELNAQLRACSTAGRAYYASDTTTLNNTFKFIAGQVAELRVSK